MAKKNMNVSLTYRVNNAEYIPDDLMRKMLFAVGAEQCAASVTVTDAGDSSVLYTASQNEDLSPWRSM